MGAAIGLTFGCGDSPTSPTSTGTSSTTGGGTSSTCVVTASETAGPYPSSSIFLRQDITEGRSGLPLRLELTVVNVNNSCGAVANAVVEIWQCDAAGNYSEYAQRGYDGRGQTFLRGAQTTDGNGRVTFTTIYPGWYAGRATHVHVEVRVNGNSVKTTQIAFPEDVTAAVYVTGTYAAKGQNSITNASDNVFADGTLTEMATLTGNPTTGYTGTLTIGIAV
jgi:protocatechuate 3,4-dioxygenase beta subunit